jgi:Domain of unknown function (DUF6398)
VADLDELKIPKAMRAVSEAVIVLTDEVCADLLDEEYASLARTVVAKLARKRPSPIQSDPGLIPYIPALGRDGTAELLSQIPDA